MIDLQCSECEQKVENNTLTEAKLKFPGENDGQSVKNDIVDNHYDRVGVEKCLDVDAGTRGTWIPEMCDRYALKDHDENTADTKGKGNKLHDPDRPVMPTLICRVAVEEEESKLDKHVAGEIEGEDGDVQLSSCISFDFFIFRRGREDVTHTHTHLVEADEFCRTNLPVMASKAVPRCNTL
jgi:hypothetical protein